MCSNSGAMGVRRARSNTRNEPPHEPALALLRTSDLVMGSCVGPLNDVHGPLDHERHASSSPQGARALILGQPPRIELCSGHGPPGTPFGPENSMIKFFVLDGLSG